MAPEQWLRSYSNFALCNAGQLGAAEGISLDSVVLNQQPYSDCNDWFKCLWCVTLSRQLH